MLRTSAALLRWLACFALVLAVLPSRATVVCVSGGRVVGFCPMALRAFGIDDRCAEMAAPKRSCCLPPVAKAGSTLAAGMRCELRPSSIVAASATEPTPTVETTLPVVLPAPVANLTPTPLELEERQKIGERNHAPPPKRPRAPDRARAPPIAP